MLITSQETKVTGNCEKKKNKEPLQGTINVLQKKNIKTKTVKIVKQISNLVQGTVSKLQEEEKNKKNNI